MQTQPKKAFQLKAHYFPITVIKFLTCDPAIITDQLIEVQQLAPNYLRHAPVVLDVSQITTIMPDPQADLLMLCQQLREHKLLPVGLQGLKTTQEPVAQHLGLAIWQNNIAEKKSTHDQQHKEKIASNTYKNHIVTKPVRSGMHVYAQDSHMILLAPVSQGAECIADGDIHCYAPVRGRLLAGAKNNIHAQIFCQALEADLVSIAGYYLTSDEFPDVKTGHLQVSLNKQHHIEITNFRKE